MRPASGDGIGSTTPQGGEIIGSQNGHGGSQPIVVAPTVTQNSGTNIQITFQGSGTQNINNGNSTTTVSPIAKAAPKEAVGVQQRPPQSGSSAQRKRSRLGDEGGGQTGSSDVTRLHEHVGTINLLIENLGKSGAKGNTGFIRIQLSECVRCILAETTSFLARLVNLQAERMQMQTSEKQVRDKIVRAQEENSALQQQVIELQAQRDLKEREGGGGSVSYVQAAIKNIGSKIAEGRHMPLPQVAPNLKHAPAECIIIIKGKEGGEMLTKREQEVFRTKLRETLGDEEMSNISAVRPTRLGGHTLIFQNEQSRDRAFDSLRKNEKEKDIPEGESSIVTPKKKLSRAVCKSVPEDLSIEQIKSDMYGRHNPLMQQVTMSQRTGKLYRTRLGVIFKLSTSEMYALQAQDWRLRCNMGREIRLEEFISIQQCYACGKFGHNTQECKADEKICRLCAKKGYSSKMCPDKDNREAWRCINCRRMNEMRNMKLDTMHAAAQLHKCPVAQQQKHARKMQLASSGVFTTPITKNDFLKSMDANDISVTLQKNGAPSTMTRNITGLKERSISIARRRTSISKDKGWIRSERTRRENIVRRVQNFQEKENRGKNREAHPCVQRPTNIARPRSTDGWQVVRNRRSGKGSEGCERGRNNEDQFGVNNVGSMDCEEMEGIGLRM